MTKRRPLALNSKNNFESWRKFSIIDSQPQVDDAIFLSYILKKIL